MKRPGPPNDGDWVPFVGGLLGVCWGLGGSGEVALGGMGM